MKICLVLPSNLYAAPFYQKYVKLLKNDDIKFDIIYWNRSAIKEETFAENIYMFALKDKINNGNYLKVFKYFAFSNYVKKIILNNKYDKILFLGSYAGTVALISNFLSKKYKYKYWLDIRDFTFENISIYYKMMKVAIENSNTTAISSYGYEEFLPKWNYILSHNYDKDNIDLIKETKSKYKPEDIIRISFIGLVRYYEENKKLINALKNNEKYVLQYFGMNSEELLNYCKKHEVLNTDFHGRFEPSKTTEFYNKTDIINNVYGNSGIELTSALSNKLYFAASLKIPILVSKGTMMEKIACGFNFGYAVDFSDKNLASNIYHWYKNLDQEVLKAGCRDFMKTVYKDESVFNQRLKEFLTKK